MKHPRTSAILPIAFALAFLAAPVWALADNFLDDVLWYDFIDGSETEVYVHGLTHSATHITIPSTVVYEYTEGWDEEGEAIVKHRTCRVTSIGDWALTGHRGMTSVTIPDSVTNIGERAFSSCSGLTSVTIPDGVTSMGDNAFSYCSGLTSVTIGNGVTSIGEDAFCDCSSLTNVTIGNSVTSIGNAAFHGCSGLTRVTIGNSVTSIGDSAFSSCSGLTSLAIGNSVTNLGEFAFSGCSGLTSVTIPDGVTSIGSCVFERCLGLTNVTIPDSVTSIGGWAFDGCSGLMSVTIPDSVTSIGYAAFSDCSTLTSVVIPDSVTSIGELAFSDCSGLQEFRVPKAWEGTSMLDEVWGWRGKPEGCIIIYYEPGDSGETVAVPNAWIDKNAAEILVANGGDYEAVAKAEAANGMRVWECYLAGLSPTDAAAEFKVKSFSVKEGGEVVMEWEPDLRDTEEERSYVVEGAETLEGAWGETNAASRFFRVRVGMP